MRTATLRLRSRAIVLARLGLPLALVAGAACLLAAATGRAQDQIGIYWDEAFTQNTTSVPTTYTPITGHIVIVDPTSGGGILGWECQVDITGPALVTSWGLAGQAINAQSPPRFSVGLASPLPPAARTAVASFDLLVTDLAPVQLALEPIYFASIPGEMSYLGSDNPEQLTIMTPVTGVPIVATVNADIPVAEVDRTVMRFEDVPIGESQTEFFQVTNVGGGVLSLNVGLDCTHPQFALTRTGAIDLVAGEAVQIGVRFTPTDTTVLGCAVVLGGGAPNIDMLANGRQLVTSWSEPDDILFGDRPVGSVNTGYATLQNTGETTLSVDVQWVDGDGPFTITTGSGPASLLPGRFRNVTIRFVPYVPGSWQRVLSFGEGLPDVVVTGAAYLATPEYTIQPSFVDFPATVVNTTRVQVIEVSNTGPGAFEITPTIVPPESPFSVTDEGSTIVVAPGGAHVLQLSFTPPTADFFGAQLHLGGDFPALDITGVGGEGVADCVVAPDTLDFVAPEIGQTVTGIVAVRNLGTLPLDLAPQIDRPEFTLISAPPAQVLPGESIVIAVAYTPAGPYPAEATLVLGPGACTTVTLQGRPDIGVEPGTNQVGLFFDEAFTTIEREVTATPVTVPVYLALLNADNTSGVAGWECRIQIQGEAVFTDVRFAGNAINAGDPANGYEYAVGIGLEPLPYAADGILLASFDLYVTDTNPDNVYLQVFPIFQPSLQDLMAWAPWDDISALTPMVPYTGQPTVAWLTTGGPVGTGTPTPRAVQTGGDVTLEWSAHVSGVDGFHVYRREPAGVRKRVTASLLPPGETVRFTDRPGRPAGTTLLYSYAAFRSGAEIAVSPEVAVTVSGIPAARTELLANVPNPFNPETRIRYRLAEPGPVRMRVYDVTGRLVRTLVDGHREAGDQDVVWRGRDDAGRLVSSGTYYVRLESDAAVDHRKVMLVK